MQEVVDKLVVSKTYLSLAADTIVQVAASCKFKREKNIRLSVDGLVQAHDVWMLKFFHRLDLSLHFLLHAQLANLVLVEDLESDGLANRFIFSHCSQRGNGQIEKMQKTYV